MADHPPASTRHVHTRPPSFPPVEPDTALTAVAGQVWQVLAGDAGHWRVGYYSPASTGPDQITTLERHDCPELFLLLQGRVTLLLARDGRLEELVLQPGCPVLVTAPHDGFCPDGPHTGVALVVERDSFDTEYRPRDRWLTP